MILVDANLLMYAHDAAAPEHPVARAWFEHVMNGSASVGLPWPSLPAFVRLVSNPGMVRHPVAPAVAWEPATQWLTRDNIWLPLSGPAHPEVLARLLGDGRVTSRMVPDAHLPRSPSSTA